MARFELATPCSQSRCATKLRYIPGPSSLTVAPPRSDRTAHNTTIIVSL